MGCEFGPTQIDFFGRPHFDPNGVLSPDIYALENDQGLPARTPPGRGPRNHFLYSEYLKIGRPINFGVCIVRAETAEYFHQTTLQLPSSEQQQQQQQRDGGSSRQSASGSQMMLAAAGNTTATAAGSTSPAAAPGPGGCHGDVVVNIDEKQPLICRADHILTIDTVGIVF